MKTLRKVVGIVGELFITVGTVMLLFVGWQLFINDPLVANEQQTTAEQFQQSPTTPTAPKFENISKSLKQGEVFGSVHIPRFGKHWMRLIGQGTFQKITLNKIGPGHYVSSAWPGESGNFAIAAHRTSHGAPFFNIDKLQSGDKVVIETNDGWFIYNYLQTKIVEPTALGVIAPVPEGLDGAHKGGKYLTMTSCHPKWTNHQRIIAWFDLERIDPIAGPVPKELK